MRVTSNDWLQAQYSVLGSVLISPELAPQVMSETSEQDYSGACLTVYKAMHQLFRMGIPIDPVSISDTLGSEYRKFLIQLMEITPTAANVDQYITLCREQARVLAVRDIARQLSEIETTDSARQLLEKANSLMISRQAQRAVSIGDCLKAFMERPTGKVQYLSWPIQAFNALRVKPGRFVLIGAEPSVGKTALALQCAYHWARDKRVGFFSLETDEETLTYRLLSSVTGIPLDKIQDNDLSCEEWDCICQASQDIATRKLDFVPAAGLNTAEISAKIVASRYDLVIIDYIQLIPARGSSRYEVVTNISIDLHQIAQRLKVTVVALSQLSRSTDEHTPKNSDLRESGQLEQDADIIIMLKLQKQAEPAGPRNAFVTKNKEGELFKTVLDFDGKYQTFRKAQLTGDAVSKYVADGKKVRQKNKSVSQQFGQMTVLPDDYQVPFKKH